MAELGAWLSQLLASWSLSWSRRCHVLLYQEGRVDFVYDSKQEVAVHEAFRLLIVVR